MTMHPGLLQAILDAPDDDTPRLVLADWLDEQGDAARAEFIRVQCLIAALDAELMTDEDCEHEHCEGCKERRELQRREQELLFRASNRVHPLLSNRPNLFFWAGAALKVVPDGTVYLDHLHFARGFVHVITCSWPDCFAHLDAIRRVQPVQLVRLTGALELDWYRQYQLKGDDAFYTEWRFVPATSHYTDTLPFFSLAHGGSGVIPLGEMLRLQFGIEFDLSAVEVRMGSLRGF